MLSKPKSLVISNKTQFDDSPNKSFDNTGDFKGYIVTVHGNGEYKYYITLWDSNFMVYALEYQGGKYENVLLDSDETKTNELSADYLAVVSGCTNYTEEKTKETKKANPSEPIPYTGTKTGANGWIAHYTNGVMDECYHNNPEEFCTGNFTSDIYKTYEPTNYPDQYDTCYEHKSLECCTSNKTEAKTANYIYTRYLPEHKSCGFVGIVWDGKYQWMYNIEAGGGLPESGVYYET